MKIGDKVRFLNDVGGGTVLRIEGKTVVITDDDGFEIPTPIASVVVVNVRAATNFPIDAAEKDKPLTKQYAEKSRREVGAPAAAPAARQAGVSRENRVGDSNPAKTPAEQAIENSSERDTPGESYELMLAFLPPANDKTDLYLLNDSPYRLLYSVGMYERDGSVQPLAQGQMEGDSKLLIKTLNVSQLRDVRTLRAEVMLYKNISYRPQTLDAVDVELSPIKFFRQGAFVENEFFEKKALIMRLFSSEAAEKEKMHSVSAEEIKETMLQKNDAPLLPPRPMKQPELEEVDLHAEMLVNDVNKLSTGELLELQMSRFKATLENALVSGRKGRIVFIHGIGSGKLKQELRQCLVKNYPALSFQDASFRQYGYGATMVFLG
ncbi:MAG: DUF2027 domain-containing protein [Prevotellaceae bacterium]|jgi:hypothetical protein|nr:DUF2027 domain-containing protein [Prevotellaceae bacterium]